jgi:hypothetical protein
VFLGCARRNGCRRLFGAAACTRWIEWRNHWFPSGQRSSRTLHAPSGTFFFHLWIVEMQLIIYLNYNGVCTCSCKYDLTIITVSETTSHKYICTHKAELERVRWETSNVQTCQQNFCLCLLDPVIESAAERVQRSMRLLVSFRRKIDHQELY